MNTRNVTITSKNQITLPSEYAKKLGLRQNRVLTAELREGKIILAPQVPLQNVMRQFWGKHSAKRPLSDKELIQASREIAAKRAAGK